MMIEISMKVLRNSFTVKSGLIRKYLYNEATEALSSFSLDL